MNPLQLTCLTAVAAALLLTACATGSRAPETADPTASARETVVLVHGLWRGKSSMWLLARRLEDAGFDVFRADYDSLTATTGEIVRQVAAQIDACCRDRPGPVHFVGHSMGGLAIRAYLVESHIPNRGRVVLIGSPNSGTPIVDDYQDTWWMGLAGPAANALGTGPESFPNMLPEPDYPVGVIAGFWVGPFGLDFIPEADDGLVPVESTKVPGMADFVAIDVSHSFMRYDDDVAKQTIAFLRDGHFIHE
ncbi:MAG: alpha/beta fold hydrolase [Gammaproteobacteria bacterium]